MAQTSSLLAALKNSLKAHGKTYADVAQALKVSEATIKRMFALQQLSLSRLDEICQFIGIEISDLVQLMNDAQPLVQALGEEQEAEIASDLELLIVTICVLNRWSLEDICGYYAISETDCIRKLARLDKLRVIELLPKNRIKLLIASNFGWLENGPIQRFFREQIGQELFRERFDREGERLVVLNGMLSPASNAEFQRRLIRLVKEFNDLNDDDASLSLKERHGVTLVLAMRSWHYGLFEPMRRP